MKLEMRKTLDVWILFGGVSSTENEIIIDRKKKDVRARFGNTEIVKMEYDHGGLKTILINDKLLYKRGIRLTVTEP